MGSKLALCAAVAAVLAVPATAQAKSGMGKVNHVVVIYEENHSFDNLYGGWEGVDGLSHADAAHTTQVSQQGQPFQCLMQDDVNLTSPPQPADCANTTGSAFTSHFTNRPFTIDDYISPEDTTCPAPACSRRTGCRRAAACRAAARATSCTATTRSSTSSTTAPRTGT